MIVSGKKFTGIVLHKKELDKKYMYLINIYSFELDNKKQKLDAFIMVITHKNMLLGEFVFMPYVFFFKSILQSIH